MKGQCGIHLDGVPLEETDSCLIPLDVSCRPVFFDRPAFARAGSPGIRRPPLLLRENLVTVAFEAHEAGPAIRQEAIGRLLAKAMRGGWLTLDSRPGMRLFVSFRSLSPAGTLEWMKKLELTLAAEARPYWEDAVPVSLSLSGTEAEGTLFAPGYAADPPVSARIVPDGRLTALSLRAGGTRVFLTGLDIAAGEEIELTRDSANLLTVRNRTAGTSLYSFLTADSDDGLFLPVGKRSGVGFAADAPCRARFETRGLYL